MLTGTQWPFFTTHRNDSLEPWCFVALKLIAGEPKMSCQSLMLSMPATKLSVVRSLPAFFSASTTSCAAGVAELRGEVRLLAELLLVGLGEFGHRRARIAGGDEQHRRHRVEPFRHAARHLRHRLVIARGLAEHLDVPADLAHGGDDLDGVARDRAEQDQVAVGVLAAGRPRR